ncbi:ATP-binding protein [Denitromonas iodatirespirans]|uniref:histidine kinase n=1 Tax=Denitromonas iodatirespirans TaxID=2795389 RepID=A0A944H9K7_DENI1|nr:ATP-binding protein [Denitromonas iodatirespirans]MBT0963518.1 HAMP domain-containing protein [Denitromonas iodatirespirans]
MGRLFWKSFLALWLTLMLSVVAVGTAVWLYRGADDDEARREVATFRANLSLDTVESVLQHGGAPAARQFLMRRAHRGTEVLVVDRQGRELLDRPLPPSRPDNVRQIQTVDGEVFEIFAPLRLPPHGFSGRRPAPSPWLPVSTILLASVAFSALLAGYVAKPIRHLKRAFDAAAGGQLDTRVAPLMGGRRDEIADLGHDFDRMAARLQAQITAQRRLLHDVSHELRSPLARMQAAIGLGRQGGGNQEVMLERIERESARLDTLVGELLTLSRLEAGAGGRDEQLELVELIAAIADDARFEAEAGGRGLDFSGTGEWWSWGQAELIHRAFENVIRNAVKYTAPGTQVEVCVTPSAGQLLVTVADRGPGVPADELESIFEPFHRSHGGNEAPGFGLGLAIARRALAAHGGQIHARLRDGGGLLMEMRLPLRQRPSAAA